MGTLGLGNPGGVDCRSLIKKALTAGGVGYVAPLILGTATPASAQVISAVCPGPSCAIHLRRIGAPGSARCFGHVPAVHSVNLQYAVGYHRKFACAWDNDNHGN